MQNERRNQRGIKKGPEKWTEGRVCDIHDEKNHIARRRRVKNNKIGFHGGLSALREKKCNGLRERSVV